ncbi:VOC family protein [Agromyces silvae]|uniref:VOC family protein n=1 Tax=Agromyces silvae TaxID=3388266 RepID=UPI00280A7144|nr:VOC family protein [Agromyces protaetiae]
MITGILHHGMTVSDLDRSVAWYQDALGLELVHRQRQENAYTQTLVGVPGAVLEVAQLAVPGGSGTRSSHDVELIQYVVGSTGRGEDEVSDVGVAHLAFLVNDIEAAAARVVAAGGRLRNPPVEVTAGANRGGKACYFHDPDGNTLELMQRPAVSA